MKGYDYHELMDAQLDSRSCEAFIKLEDRDPFSFQMFQKYISRIKPETLQRVLIEINKIAITEGLEDVQRVAQNSTVIKTNIHYPTNNSLVWDCIKTSTRLLMQLKEEIDSLDFIDYTKSAKRTYFNINVTKKEEDRVSLFYKQLILFTKVLNQTSNAIKKKSGSLLAQGIQDELAKLLKLMYQVYDITYRKEVEGEKVPNEDKLFSIYEDSVIPVKKTNKFVKATSLRIGRTNPISLNKKIWIQTGPRKTVKLSLDTKIISRSITGASSLQIIRLHRPACMIASCWKICLIQTRQISRFMPTAHIVEKIVIKRLRL